MGHTCRYNKNQKFICTKQKMCGNLQNEKKIRVNKYTS
jgi:hypothetical protein